MAKNPSYDAGLKDGLENHAHCLTTVSTWGSHRVHRVDAMRHALLFRDQLVLSALTDVIEMSHEVTRRTVTDVPTHEIQIHFGHERSRATYIPCAKMYEIDDYIRGLKDGLVRKAAELRKQLASPVSA